MKYGLVLMALVAALFAATAAAPHRAGAVCQSPSALGVFHVADASACGGATCSFDVWLQPGQIGWTNLCGSQFLNWVTYTRSAGGGACTWVDFTQAGPGDYRCGAVTSLTINAWSSSLVEVYNYGQGLVHLTGNAGP